jgi:hypothetical protein
VMKTDENEPDLGWLVKNRSDIGAVMLRLYGVASKHHPVPENDARSALIQLLIGTTFSLWRAVFLLGRPRDREASHQAAVEFLKIVVRDNTIGFPQDRSGAPWTGGYYLGNALLRLREMEPLLGELGLKRPDELDEVHGYYAKDYAGRIAADTTKLWVFACAAALNVCTQVEAVSGPATSA